jgi:hypothetical protein
MLYGYLKMFNGIVASHTSGTNMGTDWRDNDPDSEPVCDGPKREGRFRELHA